MPNPNEYASSELYAAPGDVVAASVNMLHKIGPRQGVQPAVNAAPKTNDVI